jgi:hypothetical protein
MSAFGGEADIAREWIGWRLATFSNFFKFFLAPIPAPLSVSTGTPAYRCSEREGAWGKSITEEPGDVMRFRSRARR